MTRNEMKQQLNFFLIERYRSIYVVFLLKIEKKSVIKHEPTETSQFIAFSDCFDQRSQSEVENGLIDALRWK